MALTLLSAAMVVVGALCLLNLVLALGIIRRLRELSALLAAPPDHGEPLPILGPGEVVGPFDATTSDGEPLSRDALAEPTLVAFFSPDCFACQEQLPGFLDYAGRAVERRQALAVVVAPEPAAELVATLTPVARVVSEPPDGPVARAFGVQGTPAYCRVESGGVVADSGFDLRALMASDPA